ncbi:MAG TPA: MMPL family transporter [Gaiellaceae bacterium]|nr:MMPL family transporter [Gaiellaceae bacterium]
MRSDVGRPARLDDRERPEPEPVVANAPTTAFSWLVVTLGWLVVPALVVAALAARAYLPSISTLPESGVRALLPDHTTAGLAEEEANRLFGASLLPRIAVVQRDPAGLTGAQQRRIVRTALLLDRGRLPGFPPRSRALPYLNVSRLVPGAREHATTAITYLGFPASLTTREQRSLADRYAHATSVPGAPARATGFLPGSVAQSDAIDDGLIWVEIATVGLVAAIIGLYLRSLVAPLVTLAAAGIAYLIAVGALSYLAEEQGLQVQNEVEPIVVVLLLAVVTDYSVFLLSGMRGRVRTGERPRVAAKRATAQVLPIIVGAGVLVAAGLAALRLASIGFVQTLGPAMAVVVLISLGVSITFVPAAMGILGRALFWPGLGGTGAGAREPPLARLGSAFRGALAHGTSRRLGALPTVVVAGAALAFASIGLAQLHLGLTPIRGLAADNAVARADRDAARGFAAGVVAPTEIVLRRPGRAFERRKLERFGRALAGRPEVAAVIGAGLPTLPRRAQPVFRTRSGDAVRYLVALPHHPYGSAAIDDLHRLRSAMPGLLAGSGLGGTRVSYAGDTALAGEATGRIDRDLLVVGAAAALVNVLLLALFLRSLVAPLLLVATSVLAITATLGITAAVFRAAGTPDLTYYVPLAVGVLLLSLGTDYNLFIVGRIWQESRTRDIRGAIRAAVPRASRAISIAALALAASFATLAIIPIAPFREFAFAVCVGVLVDAFVVRTLLIPALLAAFGESIRWPARRRAAAATGEPL